MASVYSLANTTISAHAFNKQRDRVAVCANTNVVEIKALVAGQWKTEALLKGHDKLVTSIDWAPETDRIVTCSQDRNAYVWSRKGGIEWEPTLVLLRFNRSATFVRWSPTETKFAVASGANVIAVCHYDAESDWWVAKHIKKSLSSTVLSLDWHPDGVLLAAGSTDGRARVFSGYLKGIDSKPPPSPWGDRLPFGTVCADIGSLYSGWVHDVAFSPSGDALAFCAHDGTLSVIYPAGPGSPDQNGLDIPLQAYYVLSHKSLPLVTLEFISDTALVAAGHDCEPFLYEGSAASGWSEVKSIDTSGSNSSSKLGPQRSGLKSSEAFNRFHLADSRGVDILADPPTVAKTKSTLHANTITSLRPYAKDISGVSEISTTGADGRLVLWPLGLAGGVSQLAV